MSDAPAGSQRLFFAIWPDAPARKALAQLAVEVARDGQGRAMRSDNLHITLAFLGSIASARLAQLEVIGARAAAKVAPFTLSLDRLGGGSYAISWLAPDRMSMPLRALHDALASSLREQDFALERRMFRPHVTLARDCLRASRRGTLPAIGWRVDRLALVASTSAPGGSVYQDVCAWPLRGDPGAT
jgi:2'-5' RNA ligase